MLFQGKCPHYRTVSPPSWHALRRAELAHCRSAGKVSRLAVSISPGWRACRTHPSYGFLLREGAFVVGFG
jgi:hypothetical protein